MSLPNKKITASIEGKTFLNKKKEKYDQHAENYWDVFYKKNENKFFKDRHWLSREFQELVPTDERVRVLLELGCGVGNTIFPLHSLYPHSFAFHCTDFSKKAVEIFKQSPSFHPHKMNAFVCDATNPNALDGRVPEGSCDFVLLIFVLSAISPAKFFAVVNNAHKSLKKGGLVLLRDYAREDALQQEFEKTPLLSKIEDNFYVRGDGTRAYYFSKEEVEQLFTGEGLFGKKEVKIVEQSISNNKEEIKMERKFLQCKFEKK